MPVLQRTARSSGVVHYGAEDPVCCSCLGLGKPCCHQSRVPMGWAAYSLRDIVGNSMQISQFNAAHKNSAQCRAHQTLLVEMHRPGHRYTWMKQMVVPWETCCALDISPLLHHKLKKVPAHLASFTIMLTPRKRSSLRSCFCCPWSNLDDCVPKMTANLDTPEDTCFDHCGVLLVAFRVRRETILCIED